MKFAIAVFLTGCCLMAPAGMSGQEPVPVPKPFSASATKEQKEALRRFNSVSARATANFASADSIDASLRQWGVTLHPQLISLRVRIEGALREAQGALDRGSVSEANEAMDRATGYLNQFAQRLGGD